MVRRDQEHHGLFFSGHSPYPYLRSVRAGGRGRDSWAPAWPRACRGVDGDGRLQRAGRHRDRRRGLGGYRLASQSSSPASFAISNTSPDAQTNSHVDSYPVANASPDANAHAATHATADPVTNAGPLGVGFAEACAD